MQLSELTKANTLFVSANDYAIEALSLMRQKQIEHLVVLDGDEIAGVVYARDLEQQSSQTLKDRDVREYLNTHIAVVEQDTPLLEANRLLHRHNASWLAVIRNRRFVGMVAQDALQQAYHQTMYHLAAG